MGINFNFQVFFGRSSLTCDLISHGKNRKKKETNMDCSESRDWTTVLEYDILGVILNKMTSLYDYLQFSLICKSWNFVALCHKHQRSVITSQFPQLPMLIVPSKDGIEKQHCLYHLTNNKIRTDDFKFCFNKRCCVHLLVG